MLLPSLRTLVQTLSGRARRPRRPARAGCRPILEGLEDRLAPARIAWANPAGGLWNVGGNWSGGVVPGPADDAFIGALNAGAAVTHNSGADAVHSLSLSSGSALRVTSGSSLTAATSFSNSLFGQLTADTGGVFTANGSSTIINGASLFATNGGAIHLPGFTGYSTDANATLQASGAGSVLDLPNVVNITDSPPLGGVTLNIAATSGGRVNLSGMTNASVVGPGPRSLVVSAEGSGSRVDLTALTHFFVFNVPPTSRLTASNGGTVNLNPGMLTLTNVGVSLASEGTVHVGTLQLAAPLPAVLSVSGGGNTLAGNLAVGGGTSVFGPDGSLTVTGSYVQTGGSTTLSGGTLTVGGGLLDLQGGTVSGAGTIDASVRNAATLTVGTVMQHGTFTGQPGVLQVNGSYTQTTAGTLVIPLGGLTAGSGYSQLIVRDTARLAGALSVVDVNGFAPHSGDRFDILSAGKRHGRFAHPDPRFTFDYTHHGLTLVFV
jgi:hypothetical protein